MRPLRSIIALAAALTALSIAAQTAAVQTAPVQAWKWRDASGQINVSDLPPPASIPAKDILERPPLQLRSLAPAVAASAAPVAPTLQAISTPRADPELEARRKRAIDEQAALQRQQQERDAVVRADNCSRAKSALALLTDGQRVYRANAQGEREAVDDKTREDELQRVRAVVASDCR
jgi:hypothetical protein